jgi:hypothetical protein
MIVRITKAKAMSFPLHSYPLYKKGLMIAEMVETLENWLAHAKRKADDAINEKNMLSNYR